MAGKGLRFQTEKVIPIIQDFMAGCPDRWEVAGSLRRGFQDVGDVDIVVIRQAWILGRLSALWGFKANKTVQTRGEISGVPFDFYLAHPGDYGAQLLTWTGSKNFNIKMRAHAKRKGLLLNQQGVFSVVNGRLAKVGDSSSEEGMFSALGLAFVPPEERV